MRTSAAVCLVILLSLVGEADDSKEEIKKFEGTWITVSAIADGKKVPEEKFKASTVTYKADGTWVVTKGDEKWSGTFTVDPGKKPKTATFVGLSGVFKDKTTLDIYELEGDTLKYCYVVVPTGKESTKERPTAFESKEGSGHYLYVLKRDKSK
jgi:uncharacterized protein (TIGR03067 family)